MGGSAPDCPIRVAIIDDHPVVIEGIKSWLARESCFQVVHTGDRADVFDDDSDLDPDVILLDLSLHGRIKVENIVTLAGSGARVIVYSQFAGQSLILRVLECGARAFIAKHEGREHLVNAVVAVAADEPYVGPTMAGALVGERNPDKPRLSEQERTALLLWFQSSSKFSVARRMQVSPHTVEMYIRRARKKYAAAGRASSTKAELLACAIEDKLVIPGDANPDT